MCVVLNAEHGQGGHDVIRQAKHVRDDVHASGGGVHHDAACLQQPAQQVQLEQPQRDVLDCLQSGRSSVKGGELTRLRRLLLGASKPAKKDAQP